MSRELSTRQLLVCAMLGIGAGVVGHWALTRTNEVEQEQSTPFGRLPDATQQKILSVLRAKVWPQLNEYMQDVGEAYTSVTPQEQADAMDAATDFVDTVYHKLREVPSDALVQNILESGKTRYNRALAATGKMLVTNVLQRSQGKPSGRLSHELAADFEETRKEQAEEAAQSSLLPRDDPRILDGHRTAEEQDDDVRE